MLSRIGGVEEGAAREGPVRTADVSDSDTSGSDTSSDEEDEDDATHPHVNGSGDHSPQTAMSASKERLPSTSRMPASELAIPTPTLPSEPPSPESQPRPLQTKVVSTGMGLRRGQPDPNAGPATKRKEKKAARRGKKVGTKAERREARKARRQARRERKTRKVQGRRPPRYFVISDHPHKNVVVCLRGTMSVDDIATDLTCEVADFDTDKYWDDPVPAPAAPAPPSSDPVAMDTGAGATSPHGPRKRSGSVEGAFTVHEGFLEIATAMGGPDGPVTRTVARALKACPGYELVLVGHSLGAGIASLLGLMWAE